jgi:hypothetical protein
MQTKGLGETMQDSLLTRRELADRRKVSIETIKRRERARVLRPLRLKESASRGSCDLCDRDREHASRYNVETTITAARTKTRQSLQYERLLTKEGSWADKLLASRRDQLRKRQTVTLEPPSKEVLPFYLDE